MNHKLHKVEITIIQDDNRDPWLKTETFISDGHGDTVSITAGGFDLGEGEFEMYLMKFFRDVVIKQSAKRSKDRTSSRKYNRTYRQRRRLKNKLMEAAE